MSKIFLFGYATSFWPNLTIYITHVRHIYVFPFSFQIANGTLTLHSGSLHFRDPLKKGAVLILGELVDITWLFLKTHVTPRVTFF